MHHHLTTRGRVAVATSRDSNAADDPVTNTSTRSVSSRRRTNRSQPATIWISSKHHTTASASPRVRQLFGQNATQPYGVQPFSPYIKEVKVHIPP